MANVKEVMVSGEVPFYCHEHAKMVRYLGQLNAPCFGLRIKWYEQRTMSNKYGGQTMMYRFRIEGQEAVHTEWVRDLMQAVVDCGGSITACMVYDIEASQILHVNIPKQKSGENLFRLDLVVELDNKPGDDVNACIDVAQYIKDALKLELNPKVQPSSFLKANVKSLVVDDKSCHPQ